MSERSERSREELIELILRQHQQIEQLQQIVVELQAEIARLKGQPPSAPAPTAPTWVKPNRAERRHGPRKKREQACSRPKQEPTRTEVHSTERCPDCGQRLGTGWPHRVREVIDIPLPRAEVVHHVVMAHQCGRCKKRIVTPLDLSGLVVGKRRFGVRLMSLVAHLVTVCRMPIRQVRDLLNALYGIRISVGQISELLHAVAEQGRDLCKQILDQVRGSPYVHADETGWRQDGVNGYLWSFSTQTARYYTFNQSRGHQVAEETLGDFHGVLNSDFYGGYNFYPGEHQRCWVHLLRDVKDLREKHPDDLGLANWAERLYALYRQARDFTSPDRRARVAARASFQKELVVLGTLRPGATPVYAVLAARLLRFEPELFTFVQYPEVPSDNNAAERTMRPVVIGRKVSGGTRSHQGSQTKSTLLTLFHTWTAQGLNSIGRCDAMLARQI